MADEPRPIQILDFFRAMAADLGARIVRPAPDGSLRIAFIAPVRLRDGTVLFDLAGSDRAVVAWHPEHRPGAVVIEGVEGSFHAAGLDRNALARLARRLATVYPHYGSGGIRPFGRRTSPPREIRLDEHFLEGALSEFLLPGRTCWGPWQVEQPEIVEGDRLRVRFRTPDAEVVLDLFRTDRGVESSDARVLPSLAVRLSRDTRGDSERRWAWGGPDEYLLYALRRALDPRDTLWVPRDSDRPGKVRGSEPIAPPDEPPRPPLPLGAARVPSTVPPALDEREETSPWAFFLSPVARGTGSFEVLGTSLEADEGLALVAYAHPSCYTKIPIVRSNRYAAGIWNMFHDLPVGIPDKPIHVPPLSEMDIVLGRDQGFRMGVQRAIARPETQVLVTFSTCVADLVGLDPAGIVAETVPPGSRLSHVCWTSGPSCFSRTSEFWSALFRGTERDLEPVPGSVNLVGFAPQESRVAAEIEADLQAIGVRVRGFLLPSFRTWVARRFGEAACTIVNRDRLVHTAFHEVMATLPKERVRLILPPFGPSATRDFYEAVQRLAEGPPGEARPEDRWEPWRGEWDQWRRRAMRHEVAVVVGPRDLPCLTSPEELYGLDLVGCLREMGFRVRILCVGESPFADSEEVAREARIHFGRTTEVQGEGIVVQVVEPERSPIEVLRETGASLVFTEHPPDRRILLSGRMFFHPRDFEMGYAGAVRTIRRLVRLAEGRFFATFGSHSAPGGIP